MALAKLLPRLRPLDQALAETRADEPDGQTAKRREGKGVACSELQLPSILGGPY